MIGVVELVLAESDSAEISLLVLILPTCPAPSYALVRGRHQFVAASRGFEKQKLSQICESFCFLLTA